MTVFGTPEQITNVGEEQLLEALDSKYDTLRDKLLSEALMKEMGAAEWQALSEQERQARLVKMKLEEKRLRREGNSCLCFVPYSAFSKVDLAPDAVVEFKGGAC